jgi:aminoglycoside phosphotransferase (APT) family kinase protein
MARERSARGLAAEQRRSGESSEGAQALAARLAEVLGEPLTEGVRQLSSGASRATFAFATAAHGRLVLQMQRDPARAEERPGQAELLAAAARESVPVPRVIAHGGDDAVLGASWIVMEEVRGTTDPAAILAGEGVPAPAELIESIAAALAAVHRVPADEGLAPRVDDPLAQLRAVHDRLGQPHPTFELAFRALGRDRPPARRTLVHGDFRVGNLMVAPGGVSAVLDWELAHLGDPLEDLGWLCVPAWRFTRPDRPAGGLGTREQLVAAYERHAGVDVDLAAVRQWELAGTLRWGVICVMQAFTHLSGASRSVEHAVIGRRACEVEWDLLEMLADSEPAAARQPSPRSGAPSPRPALHDRPTAAELLHAARDALGEDVLPVLEGRRAFQLRVALRALGMVARELDGADAHAALRAAALAQLRVADESELAASIRSGALDGREREVRAVLRELVRAKLEVANPRYLEAQETRNGRETR